MPKRSKRYTETKKLVEKGKIYSPTEAVALAKKIGKATESLELHAKLGIDPKKGEQQVRGTISLPNASGKSKKIAAFVDGAQEKEAKEAGAELVGGEDLINDIAKTEKIEFEIAVATPAMMPKMAKIAKILGPKGLMPNPKTETVSPNVKKMIEELKKGKIAFKNDDTGNVHVLVGKLTLDDAKLLENLTVALDALKRVKPSSSKGNYLLNLVVKTTMGPGIKIAA
ncbi:MAG: 50S ribosomal protein L1 [bacterium]